MSEHLLEKVALELGLKGRIVENSNGRVVALIIMMKTLALTLGHSALKVYVQGCDSRFVLVLLCSRHLYMKE